MAIHKLQRTRSYSQFAYAKENRGVDVLNLKPQHTKLRKSMQKYGFLPSFPLMVSALNGKFVVKDGQHRLTFAQELGLDVYFVIDETDINIAEINQAQAGWTTRDFAQRWASMGRKDYAEAIAFADHYAVNISQAFSMLAGTIVFKNIQDKFHDGNFKIVALDKARRVASCYQAFCKAKSGIRHTNLLACMWACCHVDYFEEARLIETASRRPDLIQSCGTRDAYMSMIEEMYNYHRKARSPIAFDANEAMARKNPSVTKPKLKAAA